MVPRRLRLSRRTFPVSGYQNRVSSVYFILSYSTSPSCGGCAVVISKKVAKRSVDRHRLKRRIFSVLRPWCHKDMIIVVHTKKGAETLSFSVLSQTLNELLMKTGLSVSK